VGAVGRQPDRERRAGILAEEGRVTRISLLEFREVARRQAARVASDERTKDGETKNRNAGVADDSQRDDGPTSAHGSQRDQD